MEHQQIRERVRTFYVEVFNRANLEVIDEMIDPEFEDHDPSNPSNDREGARRWFETVHNAFPDMKITIEDVLVDGEKAAVRFRMRGTHSGEILGVGPTGRQVTGTGMDVLRFRGEKIIEHWGEFDTLGMMQQLGAVPGREPTVR